MFLVEALKLYHTKLSYSSLLALLACIVQKMEMIDPDQVAKKKF